MLWTIGTRRWRMWGTLVKRRFWLIALTTLLLLTLGPDISLDISSERGRLDLSETSASTYLILQQSSWAQTPAVEESTDTSPQPTNNQTATDLEVTDGYPVRLAGEDLFVIQERVGSFSAEERAAIMSQRIQAIAADPLIQVSALTTEAQETSANIILQNKVIVTITEADAKAARQPPQILVDDYRIRIQTAIRRYREERSQEHLVRGALFSLVSVVALIAILGLLGLIFPWLYRKIESWQHTLIRPIRLQSLELVSAERTTRLLISGVKLVRFVLTLIILYVFVPLILSFFPWTKHLGRILFRQISMAFHQIGQGFINYLPNVFIVAIVILIAFYTIRFIRPIFHEIAQGNLPIPGFYPEWANPTFNLFKVLIIALALIVAVPYLPGAESPAFQGVSLFLGVLFSLGSTSAVANVVSGIILVYTRAFQAGDRVKIADAIGDVEEKTLLVTRIRTPKNVLVTIPNAAVLGGNVINFSASVREEKTPLVLHGTITLGYDVPWRQVYQVLIDAASATDHILADPAPFVLQTSLDDFYVSYELNAYTQEPGMIPRIYSQLR
ncbi:MAG: mechanosensitive ion channel family protein [Merismopedia sp. SIO2A8]|nr:mechanosensitive ion channel family protein [Merismopedia sp. SIO2A8]